MATAELFLFTSDEGNGEERESRMTRVNRKERRSWKYQNQTEFRICIWSFSGKIAELCYMNFDGNMFLDCTLRR